MTLYVCFLLLTFACLIVFINRNITSVICSAIVLVPIFRSSKSTSVLVSRQSCVGKVQGWMSISVLHLTRQIMVGSGYQLNTIVKKILYGRVLQFLHLQSKFNCSNVPPSGKQYLFKVNKNTRLIPAGIYFFKINHENIRTMCEICSKLTICLKLMSTLFLTLSIFHILL